MERTISGWGLNQPNSTIVAAPTQLRFIAWKTYLPCQSVVCAHLDPARVGSGWANVILAKMPMIGTERYPRPTQKARMRFPPNHTAGHFSWQQKELKAFSAICSRRWPGRRIIKIFIERASKRLWVWEGRWADITRASATHKPSSSSSSNGNSAGLLFLLQPVPSLIYFVRQTLTEGLQRCRQWRLCAKSVRRTLSFSLYVSLSRTSHRDNYRWRPLILTCPTAAWDTPAI